MNTESSPKKYHGKIKMYNGTFGFIRHIKGDIYFHCSNIKKTHNFSSGDWVTFEIEKLNNRKHDIHAIKVEYSEKAYLEEIPEFFGEVEWFDSKGFGVIASEGRQYFFHVSNVSNKPKYIGEGNLCFFEKKRSKKNYSKLDAVSIIFLKNQKKTPELEKRVAKEISNIKSIDETYELKKISSLLEFVYLTENESIISSIRMSARYRNICSLYFRKIDFSNFLDELSKIDLLEHSFIIPIFLKNFSQNIFEGTEKQESEVDLDELNTFFNRIVPFNSSAWNLKNNEFYQSKLRNIKFAGINTVLSRLNFPQLVDFLKEITTIFLSKPLKNRYSDTSLYALIEQGKTSYIKKNVSLFSSDYRNAIHSLWDDKSKFLTRDYETTIFLIKRILDTEDLSNEKILEYYTNKNDIKYIDEINRLIIFNEIYSAFSSSDKNELFRQLIPFLCPGFKQYISLLEKEEREDKLFIFLNKAKTLSSSAVGDFLNEISDTLSLKLKLKLWVYELSSYFNFNQFCFYFFTLSPTEKKTFNKKVRYEMGEELKKSMLKQRIPWTLEKEDEDGKEKIYVASWKSIWFEDKYIMFCENKYNSFSYPYAWDFSEEKFNLLYDYIAGKRLKELKIRTKNNRIVEVQGLELLEEVIWKIQIKTEIESGKSGIRLKSTNRIPINILLRNECVKLLNRFQLIGLEPTRVLESTFNENKKVVSADISLLYSIPINNGEVAIIWESLELSKSKATHIFKCTKSEYNEIFPNIEEYIQSKMKVRSSLNSTKTEDVERQKRLKYLCRIDHDNFNFSKWENSLYQVLPYLKEMS